MIDDDEDIVIAGLSGCRTYREDKGEDDRKPVRPCVVFTMWIACLHGLGMIRFNANASIGLRRARMARGWSGVRGDSLISAELQIFLDGH